MSPRVSNDLRVREVSTFSLYIPFKRAHRISLGLSDGRQILLVSVKTQNGLVGLGEAIAHPAFSGEALDTLRGGVNYLAECVVGQNALHLIKSMR